MNETVMKSLIELQNFCKTNPCEECELFVWKTEEHDLKECFLTLDTPNNWQFNFLSSCRDD